MKVNKGFENENGKLKCDCAFIDCQCINEIKKEVAREIFEEIEKNPVVMRSCIFIDKKEYDELKKKYIG